MFRWIAALCVAALLALPGMAQQGDPKTAPAPDSTAEEAGEPFEPLFMLDDEGRLVLVGPYGETEVDLINATQRGAWRAKLSRKIEVLIRAGVDVDPSAYLKLLTRDHDAKQASEGRVVRKHLDRARVRHMGRWKHLRRLRARHCRTVLRRLGLEGEEVSAVRPLLEQVLRAQRSLAYGDWRARRPLHKATDDAGAKALLHEFRTGKRARESRLGAARQRLREVVTVKQEALLVAQNVLD